MTEPRTQRPIPTPSNTERPSLGHYHSVQSMTAQCRALVRLAVATVALGVVPATVSAHGAVGHGGASVPFPVVVGVPVIAGVLGGGIAIKLGTFRFSSTFRRRVRIGFGLLLLALAGTFALSALERSPLLCLVGGSVGALTTAWIARRGGSDLRGHSHHADLTLGGICLHRVLEGVLVGAVSITNAVVGVFGVVVVASHATLETAIVGGLYRQHRLRAVGAITLLQVGYTIGAIVGVVAGVSVPVSAQNLALGLVAGILLIVGSREARTPTSSRAPA